MHDRMKIAIVGAGAMGSLFGAVLARTDAERAYVVMMRRYLPVGLLGLVAASLFAAFMSTVDTHVNLAASFFVNDVYRRFLAPGRDPRHYVLAARLASAAVLWLASAGIACAQTTALAGRRPHRTQSASPGQWCRATPVYSLWSRTHALEAKRRRVSAPGER